ncbi:allatostatin-A receptor-like [Pogonomyrmex barbatus]|uniref:Allatostatin-A receptor-like n=1 Tax=Pogonomyrmex barbatus TaxID=144034 RepID=A0A6I9WNN5_9HYME|nr:allatostatin-A receptor-like [Pogonomyrmex barbatus]XP_011633380.1 allatostatin-A receptor-like [Pogonomyrmex barbatus]XP_011633390.1 allatostatin-A receptor-like [Pogonomyrmex barbatus]XP_011633398.1 allatostatin-A receptor-like [Pogonomyrmex barbatus]XP_011633406.1 allatostatin-A receptor-like [Pogonomyrmex barbatus]XP_011633413.1 allatostatin-A receptor-like [Pogonomyrmex barbatus]
MKPEVANASDALLNCSTQFTSLTDVEACRHYYHEFEYELVHSIVVVVVPLFFGIIGILGLAGNSLVVVVVAANPGMRSTTNILIINLAVADLLFVIFCIPFTATDFVLPYWPFGNVWCKIVQYLIIVTAYASVYTLVLMSLDRYLAVVHPIASMSWRTENHAIQAICVTWVVILALSTPALVIHGEIRYVFQEHNYSENLTACRILEQYDWTSFQMSFFLTSYVLPLVLICIFYMSMLVKLWRGARISAESRRGRRRVTRLVFVVVGVFAACWCPIQVILVTKSLEVFPLTTATIMVQIASHILAYTNSCINPFLYAFLSDNFRKAFRKIIYCRPRAEPNNRLGPTTRTTRAASTGDIL